MMTRSALARRTEEQLQVALKELKAYKDQCQTLTQERDDNEKEISVQKVSKMMTRSALARRTEEQLQVALKELKAYKDQCQTLTQERDDNEKEMLLVLQKNTQLKSELYSLSRDYEDSCKHNSELQSIVDSFDQCREEYEGTLKNSAALLIKLNNAEEYIRKLEDQPDYHNYSQTQDLFKKLIPNVKLSVPCNDITTIDLTCDGTVPCS